MSEEVQFFCCPRCDKRFEAVVLSPGTRSEISPKVELILCAECEESLDPSNLFHLWLDLNNEDDIVH